MKKYIRKVKEYINKKKCSKFGCVEFEEVYAVESKIHGKVRYSVIERCVCSRCNKVSLKVLKKDLSRVDLLKSGWFILNRKERCKEN